MNFHEQGTVVMEDDVISPDCSTGVFNVEFSQRHNTVSASANIQNVIRRIEGYLCYFEGDEAVVCFVDRGKEFEMIVPAKNLIRNGITHPEQPFEFVESEVFDRNRKIWENTFSYIPLCKADDFVREPINLSKESREQLNSLLAPNAEN